MKNYIDLFSYYKQEFNRSNTYYSIKHTVSYSLIVLFVVIISLIIFSSYLNTRIDSLQKENKILLADYLNRRPYENKIKDLIEKKAIIQNYLKEDTQFFIYYHLLENFIDDNKNIPQIEHFSLDNKQKAQFVISVPKDDLSNFTQAIEKNSFLNQFDGLTLQSIQLSSSQQDNYDMAFTGQFKKINEKNN